MSESSKKYFKPAIYIVGMILWFAAVYSIYPALANVALGTLEPGCAPGDAGCTVDSPLVTNITTSTNVVMTNYPLSFDTSTLYIDPTNNRIGINTTSPLSALDVYGNLILSGTDRYLNFGISTSSDGYGVRDNSGTLQFKNSSGSWIDMVTSTALSANSVGSIELSTTTVTAGTYGTSAQSMILVVDEDGRITNLTTSSISIATSQISSGILGADRGGTGTSTFSSGGVIFSNGSNLTQTSSLYWDNSDGKLGIGTNSPGRKLTIRDSNGDAPLRLKSADGGQNVDFHVGSDGRLEIDVGGGNNPGRIGSSEFMAYGSDTGQPYMTVDSNELKLYESGDSSSYTSFSVDASGDLTVSSTGAIFLQPASSTLYMSYDESNFTKWTIGSDGQLSIASGQPTTTFSNNVVIDNLYSGMLSLPEDGGLVDLVDISVNTASGTAEGYNFLVDTLSVISVWGISD